MGKETPDFQHPEFNAVRSSLEDLIFSEASESGTRERGPEALLKALELEEAGVDALEENDKIIRAKHERAGVLIDLLAEINKKDTRQLLERLLKAEIDGGMKEFIKKKLRALQKT